MTSIVDDLLMLSRIDAHQEELRPVELDLVELVRHTVDKLQTMAGEQRDRAHTRRRPPAASRCAATPRTSSAPCSIWSRTRSRLRTPAIPSTSRVQKSGKTVEIAVTDEGRGMTPDELLRAFDRFYRPDASRSREHGGSGLGLSIAHWIARQHGGDIVGTSTLGEGTPHDDHAAGPRPAKLTGGATRRECRHRRRAQNAGRGDRGRRPATSFRFHRLFIVLLAYSLRR